MLSINKTINLNGTITIDGKQAAFMSATIQPDGKYNISYSVQDVALEQEHSVEVEEDRKEFDSAVRNAAKEVTA